MEQIIIDTNFLLIPAQFNVDIFDEIDKICTNYKLYIVDKTIDELKKIIDTAKKASDKRAAKLALDLIKAKDINIIYTAKDKSVDDLIIDLVNKGDYTLATQDKLLKERLKTKIIVLRQKKYLKVIQ